MDEMPCLAERSTEGDMAFGGKVNLMDWLRNEPGPDKTPGLVGSLGDINKYLATRTDLAPQCDKCKKPVSFKLVRRNTMRFECHDRVEDEYISTDILGNADRTYEYLTSLPDKKRFIQPIFNKGPISRTRTINETTMPRSYSTTDFLLVSSGSIVVQPYLSGDTNDLRFDVGVERAAKPKPGVAPLAPDSTERKITFDE